MEPARRRHTPVKDPYADAVGSALKVGIACGGGGFLFGGAVGILRGLPTFFAATATAIQTFGLGATFTFARLGVIHAWTTEEHPLTSGELVKATAIAGGFSGGAIGAIFRGRANVLPGMLMWCLFGAVGQHVYNRWTMPRQPGPQGPGFWKRVGDKSWTPFRVLSNEEYATMLKEQQFRLDVEISIIEDKIAAIKERGVESTQSNVSATPTGEIKR